MHIYIYIYQGRCDKGARSNLCSRDEPGHAQRARYPTQKHLEKKCPL